MDSLPTMDDLDCEPTTEELSKAIVEMAPWKAPGSDGIPADLLRHCKSCLVPILHDILVKCWREGIVPQDMRDSKIITLYKNKGSRSDCNNYRGISLLAVAGKAFARLSFLEFRSWRKEYILNFNVDLGLNDLPPT